MILSESEVMDNDCMHVSTYACMHILVQPLTRFGMYASSYVRIRPSRLTVWWGLLSRHHFSKVSPETPTKRQVDSSANPEVHKRQTPTVAPPSALARPRYNKYTRTLHKPHVLDVLHNRALCQTYLKRAHPR